MLTSSSFSAAAGDGVGEGALLAGNVNLQHKERNVDAMAGWTHLFSSASEGMDWLLAADARLKESWSMLA